MALSNAPNGLTSFGIPVLPGLPGILTGNYFFVDPDTGSEDANHEANPKGHHRSSPHTPHHVNFNVSAPQFRHVL